MKTKYSIKGEKTVERNNKLKKVDYKKEYKFLFNPSAKEPEIVEVPAFKYIMIDGQVHPAKSKDFQDKIQVLYGLAFTIKFMLKLDKDNPFDFVVPPLSGLWYADDCRVFTEAGREDEWKWTLMIIQPDRVTQSIFEKAMKELIEKKNPLYIDQAYFKIYQEGLCAQIMHIGPYDKVVTTIDKLHSFLQDKRYTFNGYHHEIYLSDPRRCKPERLKTIERQPIKKKVSR